VSNTRICVLNQERTPLQKHFSFFSWRSKCLPWNLLWQHWWVKNKSLKKSYRKKHSKSQIPGELAIFIRLGNGRSLTNSNFMTQRSIFLIYSDFRMQLEKLEAKVEILEGKLLASNEALSQQVSDPKIKNLERWNLFFFDSGIAKLNFTSSPGKYLVYPKKLKDSKKKRVVWKHFWMKQAKTSLKKQRK